MWFKSLMAFYSPSIAPAVMAAGVGALGSIAGGIMGSSGASKANRAAMKMLHTNLNWQERMSNSAYQRAMQDMRKAGLNPMLAYMQGGASTPSAPMAPVLNEKAALGEGVSQAAMAGAQLANVNATTAKTVADTKKAEADTMLSTAQAKESLERTTTYNPQVQKVNQEIQESISRVAVNSVTYNKVLEETENLKLIPNLTLAHTKESLARAGLTSAQVAEIAPRIQKLIAETDYIKAGVGSREILSFPGNYLKELFGYSAKDVTLGAGAAQSTKNGTKYLNSPNYRRYQK